MLSSQHVGYSQQNVTQKPTTLADEIFNYNSFIIIIIVIVIIIIIMIILYACSCLSLKSPTQFNYKEHNALRTGMLLNVLFIVLRILIIFCNSLHC